MKKALLIVLCIFITCLFLFTHSTPERAIRAELFFDGHFINAFKTEIHVSNEIPAKGKYYCENPKIGSDFYSVNKSVFKLWFVDLKNSGGG